MWPCTVSEKAKNREIINNLNNKRNATSLLPTSTSTSTAASQVKKVIYVEKLRRRHPVSTILNNIDDDFNSVTGPKQAPYHWGPGLLENVSEEGRQLGDSWLSWTVWRQPGPQQTSRECLGHDPLCLQPPPQLRGRRQGTRPQALTWFEDFHTHETSYYFMSWLHIKASFTACIRWVTQNKTDLILRSRSSPEYRPSLHGDSSVFQTAALTTPTGGPPVLSCAPVLVKPESVFQSHCICALVTLSLSQLAKP